MKKIYYYDTYAGKIGIAEEDGAITDIVFKTIDCPVEETELIRETKRQLDEYFAGKRKDFDVPTRLNGTEFQKRVWLALRDIPYGKTASYKDIAAAVGCPKGYRAVGMANNRNPISIIYPCHRVVGSDGSLTGYGGGLDVKAKLLELERRNS
ncbi:MAG TPA: methylated-DNA--[protein]-cysteine S-methyltransferase [Firmicutes bacterium]|nr:methylated-DNA--[protein]-cysteine S-methyltransferase [Bacillota bacterium]